MVTIYHPRNLGILPERCLGFLVINGDPMQAICIRRCFRYNDDIRFFSAEVPGL